MLRQSPRRWPTIAAKELVAKLDSLEPLKSGRRGAVYVEGELVAKRRHAGAARRLFESAYLLLHEGKITTVDAIVPALRAFAKSDHSLLVVAEDVDGAALSTLVVNHLGHRIQIASPAQ